MKTLLALLLWTSLITSLKAKQCWVAGEIVTNASNILRGEIYYNKIHHYVQFKDGDRLKTFNPYQVKYFTYYDTILAYNRTFVSHIDQGLLGGKRIFFERINNGSIQLVRKEKYCKTNLVSDVAGNKFWKYNYKFMYYTIYKNEISPIKKFYRKICNAKNENACNCDNVRQKAKILNRTNELKIMLENLDCLSQKAEGNEAAKNYIVFLKDIFYKPYVN